MCACICRRLWLLWIQKDLFGLQDYMPDQLIRISDYVIIIMTCEHANIYICNEYLTLMFPFHSFIWLKLMLNIAECV